MLFKYKINDEIALVLTQPNCSKMLFERISSEQEYLNQWLNWPNLHKDISVTEKYCADMLHEYANGKSMACIIYYQGVLCGAAGFNSINHELKKAILGYWLGAEFQGKGIMGRVVAQLIKAGFDDFGLKKIETAHAIGNIPSQKVIEKAGFVKEGVVKNAEYLHGRLVDHIIYGLMKSDYEN